MPKRQRSGPEENSDEWKRRRKMDASEIDQELVTDGALKGYSRSEDAMSNAGSEANSEDESPLEELFTAVMTAEENNRSISDIFQLLPSKSEYPDYYDVIKEPIDLKMIATKIQHNVYKTLLDLEKDLLLMIKNAKTYNVPGSQIYRDALELRKIVATKKTEIEQRKFIATKSSERIKSKRHQPTGQRLSSIAAALKYEDEDDESAASFYNALDESNLVEDKSDPEDADTNPYWMLFEVVRSYGMNAKGIALSDPFNRLPNRRTYPDYYQEIKRPISLSKIRSKIKTGHYVNGTDLVDDLTLMFENAKTYNRPDSKIYEDACTLKTVVQDKARELSIIKPLQEDSLPESDNDDSILSTSSISIKKATVKTPKKVVVVAEESMNEESNQSIIDIPAVQVVTTDQSTPMVSFPVTPVATSSTAKKKINKRLVTGYIIFASEVRKSVVQANPECNFGDISRIIGTEWKNLEGETKAEYERKAQKQNEESAKEAAREAENYAAAPPEGVTVENGILECRWGKCDYQFEESSDLMEHLLSEPNGHVWKAYGDQKDKEELIFQCLFHGCGRVKKGAPPFPSIVRLIRHCKEVHVTKQQYKPLAHSNRTKNYILSKTRPRPVLAAPSTPVSSAVAVTQTPVPPVQTVTKSLRAPPSALSFIEPAADRSVMPLLSPFWAEKKSPIKSGTGVQAKPVEPLFVAAPKPNHLVHSAAYIKYIEGLRPDSKQLSNWEKQLNASPEGTPTPDRNRLPVQWLANGSGNHGNVVNALWALRSFMVQDMLSVYKKPQ